MLELNGKYNSAKVFTNNIDTETILQVIQLLNMPYMSDCQTRIMPDCHAGRGCVIGTTIQLKDKVVPNLVGVDIGCGMLAVRLQEKEINLKLLDLIINSKVPSGFSIHERAIKKFNKLNDIFCDINIENSNKSIGTLGGGNHFIELDKDKNDNLWLVIHTGSRHLGIEVCKYYQDIGIKKSQKNGEREIINDIIMKLKAEGRQKEIEETLKNFKLQNRFVIPNDLCYIEGEDFNSYIHDMAIVQEFAKLNRLTIRDIIVNYMNLHIVESFDTIHNYINMNDMILRKGAISARQGEKVLIPMNMRDGSLVCIGKGNSDWNYSAPHGAGRILSRSKAMEKITIQEFKESMSDVYSTSVVESTIDESPMVYKPMAEIMENIGNTVEIFDIIKPIYNFKAH